MIQKLKKCKICKKEFRPFNSLQIVCGPKCAILHVNNKKQKVIKEQSKELNKKKRELKQNDKTHLTKEAQKWFNRYIRLRDKNTCISCGNTTRKMDAGHYKPTGRNAALRFNEFNTNCQCVICNQHLSGNLIKYRENLIKKIGLSQVIKLEQNNDIKKYSVEELKEILCMYKNKCKEMEN